LFLDLNHDALVRVVEDAARTGLVVIAGGFHDEATGTNLARAYGQDGLLWEQPKLVPAILAGGELVERIRIPEPRQSIVAETNVGRVAIAICRDFLDMDLRVALKHASPAVDLMLNPAFTPVTADFEAAHFEARRSLYAYEVFCNHAVFGRSTILSPERGARRRALSPGVEDVLVKEIDLEGLRAERSRWESVRRPRFVQSTR
jgi:predicted amidohydrolase